MEPKKITRWRASGLHLLVSALVGSVALAVMLLLWYPPPLFTAEGGNELLFILLGVDVIAGPLITLIVYRQGKRGMRFDLAFIGTVQLAALLYGLHIVYVARPAFLVYVVDHFEVAHPADIEPEDLAKASRPEFASFPVTGPKLAAVWPPDDIKARARFTEKAMSGKDLQCFPELWITYDEARERIRGRAWPLARMRAQEPVHAKVVDAWLAGSGRKEEELRFALLRARKAWVSVLLDAKTGEPVKMLISEKL